MKLTAIAFLSGTALTIIGCGESRKVQCHKIGQVTQQVQKDVTAVHQQQIGQPAYLRAFEESLATVMADSAKTMEAVEISDKTLQELQERLVSSYQKSSDLYRQSAELLTDDGNPSDAVMQQVDVLHRQVDTGLPETIHDLRGYCIRG